MRCLDVKQIPSLSGSTHTTESLIMSPHRWTNLDVAFVFVDGETKDLTGEQLWACIAAHATKARGGSVIPFLVDGFRKK